MFERFLCISFTPWQQYGLFQAAVKQSNSPLQISTAERKVLIVLLYYIAFSACALTSFTLAARDAPKLREELQNYFLCEALPDPTQPCTKSYRLHYLPFTVSISNIFVGLFPVVNLIFAIDLNELKLFIGWLRSKICITMSTSTSVISKTQSTLENKSSVI